MEKNTWHIYIKRFVFVLGPIGLTIVFALHTQGLFDAKYCMAFVALWMASWWIFEVLPLGVTALIPLVAYPLLGITSTKVIAPIYMTSVLWLFIGGFLVAIAMQRWELHRRIALRIILFFGSGPFRVLLGFSVATAFLSMWISNTATTVMMVSIGLAVIKSFEEMQGECAVEHKYSTCLLMTIAYSATIGGIATLVGTPPNLAFTRIYAMTFPDGPEISFGGWFIFGLPLCLLMLAICLSILYLLFIKGKNIETLPKEGIRKELIKLGKMKYEEKWVFFVFISMATMWIFRKDLNLGLLVIPGWSNLLPNPELIEDSTIAVFMAMILFIVPAKNSTIINDKILNKHSIKEIPWETILLFGGGFALAKGIQSSGLSLFIGEKFANLSDFPISLIVTSLTLGVSFLTELTSNMASTEMILPILASVAKSSQINPLIIMVPATLAASCAFMLPAATAPNAIIFGSQRIQIMDMVKAGVIINIVCALLIALFSMTIIPLAIG